MHATEVVGGGMAPSRSAPNLLIFTDPAVGNRHGYYDGWVSDIFHYTGMGQKGDQEFKSGKSGEGSRR